MSEATVRPEVERSIALHREVAAKLQREPLLLDAARDRVERWMREGTVDSSWAEAWLDHLSRGVDAVVALLADRSERAHDLRQVSPFAGVLDARTRWAILRRCSSRAVPS
jgi:hypothetical protein